MIKLLLYPNLIEKETFPRISVNGELYLERSYFKCFFFVLSILLIWFFLSSVNLTNHNNFEVHCYKIQAAGRHRLCIYSVFLFSNPQNLTSYVS